MSSLGSKLLFGLALAFVLLASFVDAHGMMSSPVPRGKYIGKADYQEIAPAAINPNDMNFVCRSAPAAPEANWISLEAGKVQPISITWNAKHPGGCFVYLSYDGDKPANEMKWFKIWEQKKCIKQDSYEVTIPDYLPSGDHVVFRWEWYGLHLWTPLNNAVEFYAQCVDAKLKGFSNGQLPSNQYTMPGHLPTPANGLYWDPFNAPNDEFLTGPAVATRPNLSGPVVTSAPTSEPTTAPTSAPAPPTAAATTKPTQAPPTAAATAKPTAAATAKPTAAPTYAPTYAPTSAPATAKPTTAPNPSGKCTVGHRKCNANGTFATCVPGETWVTQACAVGTVCSEVEGNAIVCGWAARN